jgi:hypothetical protein
VYYRLHTDGDENVYMKKQRGLNSHVELGMGIMWDVKKDDIELPYRYIMTVVENETPRLYGWYPGSDLMQERLVKILSDAGVDNLQVFPAEIRHADTNENVPGYVTVNIVGRVSCANMAHSDASPLANVYYFHDLVIDPSRTRGLLMFRVHESPMIVLVHEQVAKAIQAADVYGLTLEPLSESTGL